jgi:hypothetical protein
MYKLKSIARRAALMGTAVALMATGLVPVFTYADALNPLTHRSLTLSSSAPGWDYTDGSGNATYAPANSGANGQKTGNTFSFDVSTDTTGASGPVKAMSFQYCTYSAGACEAPGNDGFAGSAGAHTRNADVTTGAISGRTADLNIVATSPTEISTLSTYVDTATGLVTSVPAPTTSGGNFAVYWDNGGTYQLSTGWTMDVTNAEESGDVAHGTATGKFNNIILSNSTGQGFPSTANVKVVFFGTNTNYITNPGAGAFFVKINTYSSFTGSAPAVVSLANVIDGGVTVANVMNQSIEIQTKVLETMDFSVGTVDPDTLNDTQLSTALGTSSTHQPCDRILQSMNPSTDVPNTLQMGNTAAENSLATTVTYSTHSYWRLSSNSSAGATVYYSGVTLSNTVGDQIKAIHNGDGVAASPSLGAEQFGLALTNGTIAANTVSSVVTGPFTVNYAVERGDAVKGDYEDAADNGATAGVDASTTTDTGSNASYHAPQLWPLIPEANYDSGAGVVNASYNGGSSSIGTKFAFDVNSNTVPTPIATESNKVVDCVTGRMRYIANIAATTPAGIYTTKVNYIAAPQY